MEVYYCNNQYSTQVVCLPYKVSHSLRPVDQTKNVTWSSTLLFYESVFGKINIFFFKGRGPGWSRADGGRQT